MNSSAQIPGGWFQKLKSGLQKSSSKMSQGIRDIFTHKKLDEVMLSELEEHLLTADVGVGVAQKLIANLRKERLHQDITEPEVKKFLADGIAEILTPFAKPLPDLKGRPAVVLFIGVNGSGKTTTLAKLGNLWLEQNKKMIFVAGDTFRAAATEQLGVWGERLGVPVITGAPGADAAGLAFEALEGAQNGTTDLVLMDTAGRLHTNTNLMGELEKITRVLKKLDATAPHLTLLVVDATIGQNAYQQVTFFQKVALIDGLVITKMDGTAKGGVVVGLAQTFNLPIYAIGCGEGVNDLRPFNAQSFANALLGVEEV